MRELNHPEYNYCFARLFFNQIGYTGSAQSNEHLARAAIEVSISSSATKCLIN